MLGLHSVFVKSFSIFSSKFSLIYKVIQHRTLSAIRRIRLSLQKQATPLEESLFWESRAPAIHDELIGVEPDVVSQLKGPHGVSGPQLHGGVHILVSCVSPLNQLQRLLRKMFRNYYF